MTRTVADFVLAHVTSLGEQPSFDLDGAPAMRASFREGVPEAGRPLAEILADPRTLKVEDIIARTEYVLAGRFATVTTVAELTGS